jgi:hypothetical protein
MQWARHGYLHFCMLWEPPQFGFGVVGALVTLLLLSQLEDVGRGSKHMLRCHYPMEVSLVKSIWKGLGFSLPVIFKKKIVVNSHNLWKMFWKKNPSNLFIFLITKNCNNFAYSMKVYLIFSSFKFWIYCQIWLNIFMNK